jgi:chromosome segregation ATPase
MSSNSPGGSERFTKESLMTTSVMHSNPNKSLREDYFEERSKLEKQNFDLKMRIYYLEGIYYCKDIHANHNDLLNFSEHMKKMQDDEQRHTMTDDSLKNEMMDLKLQLEEKTIELEQRNLYMVKAKTAIDALKVEVERLKNEADRQNDLEDRVRKLKQINDDIEMDYKQQLMVLQNEIQNLNQRLSLKDREKDIVDDRVVSSTDPSMVFIRHNNLSCHDIETNRSVFCADSRSI